MSEESAAQWYFDPPDPVEYRCVCGHFEAEHTQEGGCAGCDAGGQPLDVIEHSYEADDSWPEEPPDLEDYMMRQRGLIE